MIIGIPRESLPGETRVAATPQTIAQLIKLGYEVVVESGAGAASSFSDEAFTDAGAAVGSDEQVWAADVTQFRTHEGWLHLAAVIDLWSRRIVGW